jgi:hypothetical protein
MYNNNFYDDQFTGSLRSSKKILQIIGRDQNFKSVIDIGCGRGAWLLTCKDLFNSEIFGLDGEYVLSNGLKIPQDSFKPLDLNQIDKLEVVKKYDLAICLEVAEHLPDASASKIVGKLTQLSDVVLFSAAIPYQGGTGHVNENWMQYWTKQFSEFGFKPYDVIRPLIWDDSEIDFWYRQNVIVFSRKPDLYPTSMESFGGRSLVHPEMLLISVNRDKILSNYEEDKEYLYKGYTKKAITKVYGPQFDNQFTDNVFKKLLLKVKKKLV